MSPIEPPPRRRRWTLGRSGSLADAVHDVGRLLGVAVELRPGHYWGAYGRARTETIDDVRVIANLPNGSGRRPREDFVEHAVLVITSQTLDQPPPDALRDKGFELVEDVTDPVRPAGGAAAMPAQAPTRRRWLLGSAADYPATQALVEQAIHGPLVAHSSDFTGDYALGRPAGGGQVSVHPNEPYDGVYRYAESYPHWPVVVTVIRSSADPFPTALLQHQALVLLEQTVS